MRERKDYDLPFAAWEVRLYLDTHPDDKKALDIYRQLCVNNQGGYACLPDEYHNSGWKWINDPWPWELEFNEECGRC